MGGWVAIGFKIDQIRVWFDAKFSYSINVDEAIDLKSITVPAPIIQPFIENAIWHGIIPKGASGILTWKCSKQII